MQRRGVIDAGGEERPGGVEMLVVKSDKLLFEPRWRNILRRWRWRQDWLARDHRQYNPRYAFPGGVCIWAVMEAIKSALITAHANIIGQSAA